MYTRDYLNDENAALLSNLMASWRRFLHLPARAALIANTPELLCKPLQIISQPHVVCHCLFSNVLQLLPPSLVRIPAPEPPKWQPLDRQAAMAHLPNVGVNIRRSKFFKHVA